MLLLSPEWGRGARAEVRASEDHCCPADVPNSTATMLPLVGLAVDMVRAGPRAVAGRAGGPRRGGMTAPAVGPREVALGRTPRPEGKTVDLIVSLLADILFGKPRAGNATRFAAEPL